MERYLKQTRILDFSNQTIQELMEARKWLHFSSAERVRQIYTYVRDEIPFGYNIDDQIPASWVLKDGYGQCNTKSNLLMALLRAAHIPCRIHGFTINKTLQKGALTGLWYKLSPDEILHSWVEVFVEDKWYFLEGVILDRDYLKALQSIFMDCSLSFCGYGVYTDDFRNPSIEWDFNHTFIQDKGIRQDFGIFDSPDDLYKIHQQTANGIMKFMFRNFIRHKMNRNVDRIRNHFKN